MKVYLLINQDGKYKIGFTDRPIEARIKELRTGSHLEIYEAKSFESKFSREIETFLHRHYKHLNIQGEWFDLSKTEVDEFVTLCLKIDQNLKYIEESKNIID